MRLAVRYIVNLNYMDDYMPTVASYDVVQHKKQVFNTLVQHTQEVCGHRKEANCNLWKLRVFIAKLSLFIIIVNIGQNP